MEGQPTQGGVRPRIDFEVMREAEEPEFGSSYPKDYWDLVFEQLGRRWLFKIGMAVLALLYGVAAFAPLLASGKPVSLQSVDIGGFKKAMRVSPMVAGAKGIVSMTDEEYAASIEGKDEAPPTRVAKVEAEFDAAMLRVATMRSMLPEDRSGELDAYVAHFTEALEALRGGDGEAAVAALDEARGEARRIRKELKPLDPAKPDKGGVALVASRTSPLLESIAAWEVFLMALWILLATWPVWNWICNRILLGGNRMWVRRMRRVKVLGCLAIAAGCAVAWHGHFGAVAAFDAAKIKEGLTRGDITLLAAGESTASLVGADEDRDVAGLVTWAPIPYSFDELHEDEKFRGPTWTRKSERDPETGRPVHAGEAEEDQTGVKEESVPVEVRAGELPLNHPWRHGLGTDESGRDILTRMIWGARISLSVGILSAFLLTVIGVVIGSIAGFFGGFVDTVIMRFIEILQTIPALFLILMALAFTPPGTIPPIFAVVIVIALVRWTGVARLVRGEFLRLRDQEFVVASRALGFSSARTIFRHVLPNAMSPVLVAAAFSVAAGILTESAVSFLGLGIKEPQASWGGVVNESKNVNNWWIQVFPGVAIFITVTCYNLVGDAIRDAMDPKARV